MDQKHHDDREIRMINDNNMHLLSQGLESCKDSSSPLDTTEVSSIQSQTSTASFSDIDEPESKPEPQHGVLIRDRNRNLFTLDSSNHVNVPSPEDIDPGQASPRAVSDDWHLNCGQPKMQRLGIAAAVANAEIFFDTQNSKSSIQHHLDQLGNGEEADYVCTSASTSANGTSTKYIDPIASFHRFRLQYLIVYTAIMLADGLQGTHLYVLYEGYGYTVASLYSLGFVSGALSSPFIGPFVDKVGRKRAAMLYCLIEIIINYMEQFPIFTGLIISRVLGGITTNLLFTVFESWLVTEHRRRGYDEKTLEHVLRDSSIVSNSAAIVSGYVAHTLASFFGPVGPFRGAVAFTCFAFALVGSMWSENYGSTSLSTMTFIQHMDGAFKTIIHDSKISRIGLIQGLTEGSLQTFVFLWSPALKSFASSSIPNALGLDGAHEPAYGLIFGSFMAAGVIGGFAEPLIRRIISSCFPCPAPACNISTRYNEEQEYVRNAHGVNLTCACCYLLSAALLLIPCLLDKSSPYAFTICLFAFLLYEWMVGLYLPCESILRSIYMPNESICSIMTMLRVIVNVAVACGVIFTNYVSFTSAFAVLSAMMLFAGMLQLSLLGPGQVHNLFQFKLSREEWLKKKE